MKHRVRTHNWHNGFLETRDEWFETLELALAFMAATDATLAKIYNELGELVESAKKKVVPDQISSRYYGM